MNDFIIIGANGTVVNVAHIGKIVAWRGGSRVVMVAGLGEISDERQPHEIVEAITAWRNTTR